MAEQLQWTRKSFVSGFSSVRRIHQNVDCLGIEFQAAGLLDEEIDQLIEERNQARKRKDFARSDEIRDQLKEQGIILEDTPQASVGEPIMMTINN